MSDDNYELTMALASGMAAFEAKQFVQSLQELIPLAELGEADAQHRVAIMYQNGLGCTVKPEMAQTWMRAAAVQGHAVAQHGLGFMYMEGDCVEKNGLLAVEWFTKAAEQGLSGSKATLGMMYETGELVEKNMEQSRYWYAQAGFTEG